MQVFPTIQFSKYNKKSENHPLVYLNENIKMNMVIQRKAVFQQKCCLLKLDENNSHANIFAKNGQQLLNIN